MFRHRPNALLLYGHSLVFVRKRHTDINHCASGQRQDYAHTVEEHEAVLLQMSDNHKIICG